MFWKNKQPTDVYILHVVGKVANVEDHVVHADLGLRLQPRQRDRVDVAHVPVEGQPRGPPISSRERL